jgi:hypothetical protein
MPGGPWRGRVECMKSASLISAQFHRNPELIELAKDAGVRHGYRRPLRRGRRRRSL